MDFHIIVQALLYSFAFIAGFAISIPVGITRIKQNGACILYADFNWLNKTHFRMTGSNDSNCNFPIYFSVFALIFYSLGKGAYNIYAVYRSRQDRDIGSQMWVMPFILANTIVMLTTMIVGCMLSVGFGQFCSGITKTGTFPKCSDAEKVKWRNLATGELYDPGPFSTYMTVAQIAAWLCVLVWICQVALSILRFYRNRQKRSAPQPAADGQHRTKELEATASEQRY